jgi:hypothetical protein
MRHARLVRRPRRTIMRAGFVLIYNFLPLAVRRGLLDRIPLL